MEPIKFLFKLGMTFVIFGIFLHGIIESVDCYKYGNRIKGVMWSFVSLIMGTGGYALWLLI